MGNPLLDPSHYHGDAPRGVGTAELGPDADPHAEAPGGADLDVAAYATGGGYYVIDGVKLHGKAAARERLVSLIAERGDGDVGSGEGGAEGPAG